jgi:hypothetical protein
MSEQLLILAQRYAKERADATEISRRAVHDMARSIGLGGSDIGVLDEALATQEALVLAADKMCRCLLEELGISWWRTSAGRGVHPLAVIGPQRAKFRLAKETRLFEHCLEYRGKIAGRRIDNPKHFGCCGLLLQGFARLADQPRVLHRDDRLIGKGSNEFDLPIAERFDPLARQRDDADRLPLAQ